MTQCLRTLSTLRVDTLLVRDIRRRAASLKSSLARVGSGGFPLPAVATANATAALAELDLPFEMRFVKCRRNLGEDDDVYWYK